MGVFNMKAVVYHRYGGPEVLNIEEVPRPHASEGKVVVRVKAVSVNPADWQIRSGKRFILSEPFSFIPGVDLAGIVDEVCPGSDLSVGDHVFGMTLFTEDKGSYAEFVAVSKESLAKMSPSMSFEDAAALPVAVQTSWSSLVIEGGLKPGQKVLIHGASGGVGHIAVQIAKLKGAQVAGTASGRNQDFLKEIGVDIPINYETTPFETVVSDIDILLDCIISDTDSQIDQQKNNTRERSWRVLKKGGIFVSITGHPDQEKAAKYGVRAVHVLADRDAKVLYQIEEAYESGRLRPHISNIFPLEKVREAHQMSQSGHTRGKIVMTV